MRILITGHQGFIGSHIAQWFLDRGHEVGGIDREKNRFAPPGMYFDSHRELVNVRELPAVDAIIHCAAMADIRHNWTSPANRFALWADNVDATLHLLEIAPRVPIVFMSSLAAGATSLYAASKLAGETLVQTYQTHRGMPYYSLRLGCAVGRNYHHGHIADFAAAPGKPLSNGRAKKSFVHVEDIALACELLLTMNIASGVYEVGAETWSPRDTARVLDTMVPGITWEWPHNSSGWEGDVNPITSASALRAIGWVPRRRVEEGVREAFERLLTK